MQLISVKLTKQDQFDYFANLVDQASSARWGRREVGRGASGRSGKGKGKLEREHDGPSSRPRERVPDVELGRNIALIRLHIMFPLIPISDIRALLFALEHSFLFSGTEASSPGRSRAKPPLTRTAALAARASPSQLSSRACSSDLALPPSKQQQHQSPPTPSSPRRTCSARPRNA
ncbi:hypothetical protein JCM1840_001849 [Sporobolomyces johnsonii]